MVVNVEKLCLLGNNSDTSVVLCLYVWLRTLVELLAVTGWDDRKADDVFSCVKETVGRACTGRSRAAVSPLGAKLGHPDVLKHVLSTHYETSDSS